METTTKDKLLKIHAVTGRNAMHQLAGVVIEVHTTTEKHDDIIRKLLRRIENLERKMPSARGAECVVK